MSLPPPPTQPSEEEEAANKAMLANLEALKAKASRLEATLRDSDAKLDLSAAEVRTLTDRLRASEEKLRLSESSKEELEQMNASRMSSMRSSLDLGDSALRESQDHLQRITDKYNSLKSSHKEEVSYLMSQLTEKDTHIALLGRQLAVATVDGDWRRLLGGTNGGGGGGGS